MGKQRFHRSDSKSNEDERFIEKIWRWKVCELFKWEEEFRRIGKIDSVVRKIVNFRLPLNSKDWKVKKFLILK